LIDPAGSRNYRSPGLPAAAAAAATARYRLLATPPGAGVVYVNEDPAR